MGALEVLELVVVLDAFGKRVDPESLAQLDEGLDDRGRLVRGREVRDEGAVDLERVDRELPQVRERAVARSEVVDGEAHAERLQLVEPAVAADGEANDVEPVIMHQ